MTCNKIADVITITATGGKKKPATNRKILIKMNEPLRYKNYTFYQSSFIEEESGETSVFAVVENYGRLFPYISSIIMCFGLLLHLIIKLPFFKTKL